MRKSSALRPLDALFPGVRQAVLEAVLVRRPSWYLSELADDLGVRPSTLQRDLAALHAAGILLRRRNGNRVYFEPHPDCPILPELRGLFVKTIGLVRRARRAASACAANRDRAYSRLNGARKCTPR